MPFVAVADVAQIELRGVLNGVPVENTWYAQTVGGWDQTGLDLLTQEISDQINATWLTILSPAFAFTAIYARDLSAQDSFQSLNVDLNGTPGTNTGEVLPNNVTVAVQRSAGLTGRSSRGRIFWMGLTDAWLATNENFLAGAYASAVIVACEEIDTAIIAGGGVSVIVSRFHNNAPRVTPVVYPVVQWSLSDARIDTLRGRLG